MEQYGGAESQETKKTHPPERLELRFSPRENNADLIHWHAWGDEIFRKAKEEKKHILLNITAIWCHWCHVMDETTFSDPDVISIINDHFIPVRVDGDRNPHIQQRYLADGWPTNCILNSAGQVLAAETYLTPLQFQEMTAQFIDREFEGPGGQILWEEEFLNDQEQTDTLDPAKARKTWLKEVKSIFDPLYGGFGYQPKFPYPEAIKALFWEEKLHASEHARQIALFSLEKMSQGGLFDHEEYGFFRYSTTRNWEVPHYEKMLTDNAGLLVDYLLAYNLTAESYYLKIARNIISYVVNSLLNPTGGFAGSQDADENYYQKNKVERRSMMSPFVDRTIYTNWNAQMIEVLFLAYQLLGDKSYLELARTNLEVILGLMKAENGFYHYATAQGKHLAGFLGDQVYMGKALLTAYETTGERKYLNEAKSLANFLTHAFEDSLEGGFFDITADEAKHGLLAQREKPLEENAVAARFLTRLGRLLANDWYLAQAEKTLQALYPRYKTHGINAAYYILALEEFYLKPVHVVIVGQKEDPAAEKLHYSALKVYLPGKLVQIMDPVDGEAKIGSMAFPSQDVPVAYICRGKTCLSPILEPSEVSKYLTGLG